MGLSGTFIISKNSNNSNSKMKTQSLGNPLILAVAVGFAAPLLIGAMTKCRDSADFSFIKTLESCPSCWAYWYSTAYTKCSEHRNSTKNCDTVRVWGTVTDMQRTCVTTSPSGPYCTAPILHASSFTDMVIPAVQITGTTPADGCDNF